MGGVSEQTGQTVRIDRHRQTQQQIRMDEEDDSNVETYLSATSNEILLPEEEFDVLSSIGRSKGAITAFHKTIYKTVEEASMDGQESISQRQKIIDMTGPEVRVFSHMSEIRSDSTLSTKISSVGQLPEVRFNLGLLVAETERELETLGRRKQLEIDKMKTLEVRLTRLETDVINDEQRLMRLKEIQETVRACRMRALNSDRPITAEELSRIFHELQTKFREEYMLLQLDALAVAVALPLVRRLLTQWDVLKEPELLVSTFRSWKRFFDNSSSEEQGNFSVNVLPTHNK